MDIVERLRGEHLDCICAAYSSNECCCDTHWPEDSCREAADEIEQLRAELKAVKRERDAYKSCEEDMAKQLTEQCHELNRIRVQLHDLAVEHEELTTLRTKIDELEPVAWMYEDSGAIQRLRISRTDEGTPLFDLKGIK